MNAICKLSICKNNLIALLLITHSGSLCIHVHNALVTIVHLLAAPFEKLALETQQSARKEYCLITGKIASV